jgi:transcription antitermination factor NusG
LRSRADFQVRDRLRAAGIEEFLPTREETSRWTDRIARVTRPLFPGYCFARSLAESAPDLIRIQGVVQVLGIPAPEPIPDREIANLQRLAATSAAVALCPYVAGEMVTVARGPFAGVSGVVTRTEGSTRLVISIEILRRAVSVHIDAEDLEAIEETKMIQYNQPGNPASGIRPDVARPKIQGSKECACGATISATKAACRACETK